MMCPSSCATTPWSSSLPHMASKPAVTQRWLFSGDLPRAKALGAGSPTTYTRGTAGREPAMTISSTTLKSWG